MLRPRARPSRPRAACGPSMASTRAPSSRPLSLAFPRRGARALAGTDLAHAVGDEPDAGIPSSNSIVMLSSISSRAAARSAASRRPTRTPRTRSNRPPPAQSSASPCAGSASRSSHGQSRPPSSRPATLGQPGGCHRRLDPGEITDPRPGALDATRCHRGLTPMSSPRANRNTNGRIGGPPANSISTSTLPPRRPFTSTSAGPSGVSFTSTLREAIGDAHGSQRRLGHREHAHPVAASTWLGKKHPRPRKGGAWPNFPVVARRHTRPSWASSSTAKSSAKGPPRSRRPGTPRRAVHRPGRRTSSRAAPARRASSARAVATLLVPRRGLTTTGYVTSRPAPATVVGRPVSARLRSARPITRGPGRPASCSARRCRYLSARRRPSRRNGR